jgi:ankyrin repeat protein
MYDFIQHNQVGKIKECLEAGYDVNKRSGHETPLSYAVIIDADITIIDLLIQYGANLEELCWGETVLVTACRLGREEIVKRLVEHGANLDARATYGGFPLIGCFYFNNGHIAEYLVEKGANFHQKDNDGDAILKAAARWGNVKLVKKLAQLGADINAANKEGYTALLEAATHRHEEVVSILLQAGADPRKIFSVKEEIDLDGALQNKDIQTWINENQPKEWKAYRLKQLLS